MSERIGAILERRVDLSRSALEEALARQRQRGGRLGEILIERGQVDETDVLAALADQFGFAFLDRLPEPIIEARDRVPLSFLKKCRMVPVRLDDGRPAIALHDPAQLLAADDCCRLLDWRTPAVVLAPAAEIINAIHALYDFESHSEAAEQVIEHIEARPDAVLSEMVTDGDLLDDTGEAPVIRLVNLMFSQAVRDRASDIHIEPYRHRLKIRQRIDGILYDMLTPPAHVHAALVSRLKVMANLNIAEKRLPQDGRMEIRIGTVTVDVRVSTLPTGFGERVVLRLLYKSSVLKRLTDLGMAADTLARFEELIRAPHGIILITGPTGSGKTTTLYAALSTLNRTDRNIITIEDPVEYRIEGISQMQVNPAIGLTFASGLRTIVRQDPDVILVGEIRDAETAEIAIQAALTGHLVFSTLHTNDSVSAVTRLVKMGVEPFLIAAALNAVVAQRLVRILCPECRAPFTPSAELLESIGLAPDRFAGTAVYRAVGCPACREMGYRGRTGIFELLELNDTIRTMVTAGRDAARIADAARAAGMRTLVDDGLARIEAGVTTIEEVFRVTRL